MEICHLLMLLMSIMKTHAESDVDIDDVITKAVQETYDEPLRKSCPRQEGKYL